MESGGGSRVGGVEGIGCAIGRLCGLFELNQEVIRRGPCSLTMLL